MTAITGIVERTVNSVSMNANIDRSTTSASSSTATYCNRNVDSSNDNNNNNYDNRRTTHHHTQDEGVVSASSSSSASSASSSVLACSPVMRKTTEIKSKQSLQTRLLSARKIYDLNPKGVDDEGFPLCEFRKTFFDHLKLKSLIVSTLRISIQQATVVLAAFLSEQMEKDLKRNKLVNEGQLTQLEADAEAEQWETIEWKKRWKLFPMKLATAVTKYHAVTAILRLYEYVADLVLKVDVTTMHKLTMDPPKKAKRLADSYHSKMLPGGERETVLGHHKLDVMKTMTTTTYWANLLSFLADYSLHQGLLCYAYYKYYNYNKRQKCRRAESSSGFIGTWKSTNLLPELDPGLPDEDLIVIDEKTIRFPNGGGGFGNGPYKVNDDGVVFKQAGEETITYELLSAAPDGGDDDSKLRVTFAGGDYGSPDPVIYVPADDETKEYADKKLIAKDLSKNSLRLAANRNLGLICSAIGGGIGSIVWPGWGTVIVSAIGDNVAGAVLDDGYYKTLDSLEGMKTQQQQETKPKSQ